MRELHTARPGASLPRAALALALGLGLARCTSAPGAGDTPRFDDDAPACATCHPVQAAEFARSRHADTTASVVFRALRAAAPPADQRFCDDCHRPREVGTDVGLMCSSCHRAAGNRGVSNARMNWDTAGALRGTFDAVATTGHASRNEPYLRSAELCGTCHQVAGPGAFAETPYAEWTTSPAAAQGITCARCHMSPAPGRPVPFARATAAAVPGAPVRAVSSHRWIGPDDDDTDAASLLADTATLEWRSLPSPGALEGEAVLVVTNGNTAHALPSGARFAREVWVEVATEDAAGVWTVRSGALDERGFPRADDAQRVALHDALPEHAGAPLPFAAPAPVVRALGPGAQASFVFTLRGGPFRALRARLLYRRYRPALLEQLALSDVRNPVFELGRVERAE